MAYHERICRKFESSAEFSVACVTGEYFYYHYCVDGVDDRGWGCGYRTLQTLSSWIRLQLQSRGAKAKAVPDLVDVQKMLVEMGDKSDDFIGSREWIGTFEVSICIDYTYDIPCRILHCPSIREFTDNLGNLFSHFESIGSPAMIGGNIDAASKTLLGVAWNKSNPSDSHLLILDPHYSGKDDTKIIEEDGWVAWKPINSLTPSSFYNICLPQFSAR